MGLMVKVCPVFILFLVVTGAADVLEAHEGDDIVFHCYFYWGSPLFTHKYLVKNLSETLLGTTDRNAVSGRYSFTVSIFLTMAVTIRNVNLGDSGRYTCRLQRLPGLWVFGEHHFDVLVQSSLESTLAPPASCEFLYLYTLLLIPAIVATIFLLRFYWKKSNKDGELAAGASGPDAGIPMYQNAARPESTDQTYQTLCSSTREEVYCVI